jgi:Domain of unknown function (DUF6795)
MTHSQKAIGWPLVFLLLIYSYGGQAMSMTDLGKVCLFSKISGVILIDGIPVKNAKLVRTVNLSSKETDETRTDDNGHFEMPAVFARTITKYLPQEFSSNQEIIVHYNNKAYRIWSAVKRKPEENIEARGKPLVVKCELSGEETMIKVNNSPIFSLCTWDIEPDKRRKAF